MYRCSETIKADVRRRMSLPMRQSLARISGELDIHVVTLYNWWKAWQLQGEVLPASEKVPDQSLLEVSLGSAGWAAALTVPCAGTASGLWLPSPLLRKSLQEI